MGARPAGALCATASPKMLTLPEAPMERVGAVEAAIGSQIGIALSVLVVAMGRTLCRAARDQRVRAAVAEGLAQAMLQQARLHDRAEGEG